MLKKLIISILILLSILIIWQWPLLRYGIQQGKGQLEVILDAKPIEDYLNDPEFPDSLKSKLIIAQKARTYAIKSLGLNQSNNYTKMFDQKGEVLLWNLSACEPYELKPYQWSFPFLGKMPYKGYFKIEEAKKEQEILDSLGYDTRIRPVGGWSTLGILNDPILSNMLRRSDGALADIIIHELTHATIFIKNNIEFNENLASFIGEHSARQFLKESFDDSPEKFDDYVYAQEDSKKFREHMLVGTDSLSLLFSKLTADQDDSLKAQQKAHLIIKIIERLDTVSFVNNNYKKIFDARLPNNAYFMSLKRYHSQKDTLSALYATYDNDIKKMIHGLKEIHGK